MILTEEFESSKTSLFLKDELRTQSFDSASSLDLPPGYLEARRPKTRITYTFTPQTNPSNSMIMSPPNYLAESHPSYYISVNMNCFNPFSYITTVRRGGWDGELVGEFEMGFSSTKKQSSVCMWGYEYPLNEMMEQNAKMFRAGSWLWKGRTEPIQTTDLYWEEISNTGNSVLSCHFGKEKQVTNCVATFLPSRLPRRPGRPAPLTRLEVGPKGHDCLDEIVMSALIIERMRTSPSALKDLPGSVLKEFF